MRSGKAASAGYAYVPAAARAIDYSLSVRSAVINGRPESEHASRIERRPRSCLTLADFARTGRLQQINFDERIALYHDQLCLVGDISSRAAELSSRVVACGASLADQNGAPISISTLTKDAVKAFQDVIVSVYGEIGVQALREAELFPRDRWTGISSVVLEQPLTARRIQGVLNRVRFLKEVKQIQNAFRCDRRVVRLDPRYYENCWDFQQRFPKGVPSLGECASLVIVGDVVFGERVRLIGDVEIINTRGRQYVIPDGGIVAGRYVIHPNVGSPPA